MQTQKKQKKQKETKSTTYNLFLEFIPNVVHVRLILGVRFERHRHSSGLQLLPIDPQKKRMVLDLSSTCFKWSRLFHGYNWVRGKEFAGLTTLTSKAFARVLGQQPSDEGDGGWGQMTGVVHLCVWRRVKDRAKDRPATTIPHSSS